MKHCKQQKTTHVCRSISEESARQVVERNDVEATTNSFIEKTPQEGMEDLLRVEVYVSPLDRFDLAKGVAVLSLADADCNG